jgi:RNA recognition motif-containing protein
MASTPGCMFVGDLSVCCRESHLRDLFSQFGKVLKTEIKQGQKPFKFLGYGFITLPTMEEAEVAMRNLNGFLLLGRKLRFVIALFFTSNILKYLILI